jgi:hypothetical protein
LGGVNGAGGGAIGGEPGGEGGQTTILGTGGATSTVDAGVGGAGGTSAGGTDGGVDAGPDGTGGECDDGGVHDVGPDLGACMAPIGVPPPDQVPLYAASASCNDYCAMLFVPEAGGGLVCPGIYADLNECLRYCSVVAWPNPTATSNGDDINCRVRQFGQAMTMHDPSLRAPKCLAAGPGAGTQVDCSGGRNECGRYCDAFAAICHGDLTGCLASCSASTHLDCRFAWLVSASADLRYCALLDLAAPTCVAPPGC